MRRLLYTLPFLLVPILPINAPGCHGKKLIVQDSETGMVGVSHNCRLPIVIGHPR